MTATCKFCEAMDEQRRFEEVTKCRDPKAVTSYTVAIVSQTQWDDSGSSKNRTTFYRHRGVGYDLNYCPECGRKLKGEA